VDRSPFAAVGLWQAATARSKEAQIATRPGNGRQAARQQGTRLALVTLVLGVLGLFLGVLFPPLFLLGAVAIALGAGNGGRGQERLSSAGRGLTIAGLVVGVVCLLMTLPFLMGVID
jgi:hypothetical protein